jgi:hypothetical protein
VSATGRNLAGHERFADDAYETPYWCTRAILPHLKKGPVLDPCCGNGAILQVVHEQWKVPTLGYEFDPSRANAATFVGIAATSAIRNVDATKIAWKINNTVITNPPYSDAIQFIEISLIERSDFDKAFLLRLNFLGSQKRAEFHRKHPADIFVLSQRPSFALALSCAPPKGAPKCGWGEMIALRPDGTPSCPRPERCPQCNSSIRASSSDACEYAWFVWGPRRGNRWFIL